MQLPLVHALPGLLVARHQQHREQIPAICILTAPLIDDAVNYLIELVNCREQTAITGSRHVDRRERSIKVFLVQFIDSEKRPFKTTRAIAEVYVKQRFSSNAQGQVIHFDRNIKWLVALCNISPAFEHDDGWLDHLLPKGRHTLAMEGRLYEAALAQPGLTVVGEQSHTEKRPEHLIKEEVFV